METGLGLKVLRQSAVGLGSGTKPVCYRIRKKNKKKKNVLEFSLVKSSSFWFMI